MQMNKMKEIYLHNVELFNNLIGTFIIKGGSLFVSLYTMPAYINYFSDQKILGIWFSILSILQWILMFDLGIGNGLRNELIPAILNKDHLAIKKYISSSYIVIGCISIFILCIGVIAIILMDWNNALKISPLILSNRALIITILIVFTGVIFQFCLSLILSILYAMQKTALSNFISLFSSVLVLIYVSNFQTGNAKQDLILLASINVISINLPLIIVTFVIFLGKLKGLGPKLNFFDREFSKKILALGGSFFKIQIALLFINSSNEILITQLYGPKYVVDYQIYYKLFFFVVTLFTLITNPLWSAIAKAYANGKYEWIIKASRILEFTVIIATIVNICLLFLSNKLIKLWLGKDFEINYLYAICFVFYSSITIYNMTAACIANGIGELKCQIKCNYIFALLKIPFIILTAYLIREWINVVFISSIIILPYGFIQKKELKRHIYEKISINKK